MNSDLKMVKQKQMGLTRRKVTSWEIEKQMGLMKLRAREKVKQMMMEIEKDLHLMKVKDLAIQTVR